MHIDIPLPVMLDNSMAEVRRIQPKRVSVNMSISPLSTASMELTSNEDVPMRAWVKLYTISGVAGIFRTHVPSVNCVTGDKTVPLDHGICEIGDYLINTDLKMDDTADVVFPQIFSYYRGTLWRLGTVEATGKIKAESDHGNVLQTLVEALEACPGYMFRMDQTTTPWTLSVVARPTTVTGEGRLSRNVRSAQITPDDSELCTRVYADKLPSGYLDADTQGIHGIVEQRIEGDEDMTAAEVLEIAQTYLDKRKNPVRAITLNLLDLSTTTNESLDQIRCGQLYRLALDNGQTFEETVVSIDYPDVYGKPLEANAMLAEEADSMASVAAGLQLQLTKVTQQYTRLYKHITEDEESLTLLARNVDIIGGEQQGQRIALDDLGVRISSQETKTTNMEQTLSAAKIDVAAQTGITLTAVKQATDLVSQKTDETAAQLQVQAGLISTKVSAGDIASAINQTPQSVQISASKINLEGYVTATELETEIAAIKELNLWDLVSNTATIASSLGAGSLRVDGTTSLGSVRVNGSDLESNCVSSIGPASTDSSSGSVSIPWTKLDGSSGSIDFNVASTAYFQQAVAAAYQRGVDDGAGTITVDGVSAVASGRPTWSNSVLTQDVYVTAYHENGGGDTDILRAATIPIRVNASEPYNAGISSVTVSSITNTRNTVAPSGKVLTAIMQATASNGATRSQTFNINIEEAYNAGWNAALDACVKYNVWVADRAGYEYDDVGNEYYVLQASHREDFWKLAARK